VTGDRLFDPGGPVTTPVEMGQDAARTKRRNELLAAGVHPTTRLRLREPAGETCGSCDYRLAINTGKRTFHKCSAVPMTHGPATDVRLSWPACGGWTEATPRSSAELSADGMYRWTLRRRWGRKDGRRIAWVMLNPSTADAELDDQTVLRCRYYSAAAGFDELVVVNLVAFRATDPDAVIAAHRAGVNVVGAGNVGVIADVLATVDAVAYAWGATLRQFTRAGVPRLDVEDIAARRALPVLCLGYTADGSPRHPSRLGNDVRLVPFDPPRFQPTE
jgi:hypothetical protein